MVHLYEMLCEHLLTLTMRIITCFTIYFMLFTLVLYTEQKKLRKSQKTMQHKDTKANNYLFFIYLFRYMSSVEKNVDLSLLAPIPLLWHSVK